MTGAVEAVQTALVTALAGHAPLAGAVSGIFDGPPARAAFPYVGISSAVTGDFGHKSGRGREHRLTLSIWDDGARAGRVHRLMAEMESAIEAMPAVLDGHRLVTLAFLRSRVVRDGDGPWAGIVEYRACTLEEK